MAGEIREKRSGRNGNIDEIARPRKSVGRERLDKFASRSTLFSLPACCIFDELLINQDALTAAEISYIHNLERGLTLERSYSPALELLIPNFKPEIIKGTDLYTFVLEALEVIS